MKKIRNLIIAALAIGTMGTAFCRQNITVTRVGMWTQSNTFYFQSATYPGQTFTIILNSDANKAAMGIVMAAYSLGRIIGADLSCESCTSGNINVVNVYSPTL